MINGAGCSFGAHAVQVAKSMGAEVTAVDSTIKEDLLRLMGADHFVDYTKENFAVVAEDMTLSLILLLGVPIPLASSHSIPGHVSLKIKNLAAKFAPGWRI